MELNTVAFLVAYAISWGMIALLVFFPFRGPREPAKAAVVVSSLPALAFGAVVREDMMMGKIEGMILAATALNFSIVVGTGFDPLRAVVHWDDDKDEMNLDTGKGQEVGIADVRPRKAWPSLLLFVVSVAVMYFGWPELFERT